MRDAEIARLMVLADRRRKAIDRGSTWGMLVGVCVAFWLVGSWVTMLSDGATRSVCATAVFFATVLVCALIGGAIAKARFVP